MIFTAPMIADPGTRLEYGINSDWLGRVVEAVSGQALDVYIAEHGTGPLGMTETAHRGAVGESRADPRQDLPASITTADPASSHDFAIGPGLKWAYELLLTTEGKFGMRARRADPGAAPTPPRRTVAASGR